LLFLIRIIQKTISLEIIDDDDIFLFYASKLLGSIRKT